MITLIPHGRRLKLLPALIGYIEHAQQWALGRQSLDDVAMNILHPMVQLWLVQDSGFTVIGYLATEIRRYPQSTNFVVLHCAGEEGRLDECVDEVFVEFEKFARANGCDAMEIQGRSAWGRIAKRHGYDAPFRQYMKSLKE